MGGDKREGFEVRSVTTCEALPGPSAQLNSIYAPAHPHRQVAVLRHTRASKGASRKASGWAGGGRRGEEVGGGREFYVQGRWRGSGDEGGGTGMRGLFIEGAVESPIVGPVRRVD